MPSLREITDIDRGAWLSIQVLVVAKFASAAKEIANAFKFDLAYQKRLQDDEGNSFQSEIEKFWSVEYENIK